MTQEEYNALTDEEQNALVATEVLGWRLHKDYDTIKLIDTWFQGAEKVTRQKLFNPKHNLDHAFMLPEKLDCSYRLTKSRTSLPDDVLYTFMLFIGHGETYNALTTKPNKAIMLACLKAKGVVE